MTTAEKLRTANHLYILYLQLWDQSSVCLYTVILKRLIVLIIILKVLIIKLLQWIMNLLYLNIDLKLIHVLIIISN